jgi:menaquinone-dependent protoporphyrinogen oxidase
LFEQEQKIKKKPLTLGKFCCLNKTFPKLKNKIAREEIQNAFSEELHQMAKTEAIFGGEFNFGKMNFIEKLLVRKIAKVNESVSKIDYHSIEQFANRMEETYHPFMFLV